MPGPVAITGATGFIGSALLRALAKGQVPVRALTRQNPPAPTENLTWIRGDLQDPDALARLIDGAGAVIHCAGRVRGRSAAEFHATNVKGTANLVNALLASGAEPHFLLISSLAAREPQLSWYAASKREGELAAAALLGDRPWTAFRPGAVYGPGDRELRPLLLALRRGIFPVVGSAQRHFGLLHVNDLVAAIRHWLKSPVPDVFELDDGTPGGYDWRGIQASCGQALGRRIRVLHLPEVLLGALAAGNLWQSRFTGSSPMLTPAKLRELTHGDWVCDNESISRALGWQPRIRLVDALLDGTLL